MSNTIHFDPSDHKSLFRLMDEHGHSDTMYPGVNENGEPTCISFFPDKIVVSTRQTNNWIRTNVYHRDGSTEEHYERCPSE
jgi:hypothetical protein